MMEMKHPFLGGITACILLLAGCASRPLDVITIDTLKGDMSEWMTYRENTCFDSTGSPKVSVHGDCGRRHTGFLYILLHESTHAVDYIRRITPFVEPIIRDVGLGSGLAETEFTSGVWSKYAEPLPAVDFTCQTDAAFYGLGGGPLIPIGEAAAVYSRLSESPFVSLYASMNRAEDLVELVTGNHFCTELGEPNIVSLYRNGEMVGSREIPVH